MFERVREFYFGIFILGLILAALGYFGPWVPHKTSALTKTGLEMAEFAKFFPQVQSGAVAVTRGLFLAPLTAAAVLLGLAISRLVVRPILRLVSTGLPVLLALVALPPYGFYLAPDYRVHLILAVGGVVLVLLTLPAHRLPLRIWGVVVVTLALAGVVLALRQFALLHPLIVSLYGSPLAPGWGLAICVVGFALLLIGGICAALGPERSGGPAFSMVC